MEFDTIAALSTPMGRGGIGIIRISGSRAGEITRDIFSPFPSPLIPRCAYWGRIHDRHLAIGECLFTFFPAPHSYSGEDIVEISLHSNPYLIEEVLQLIFSRGSRMALPGEFTYRAFKNGKMDLLQAEAVHDLIASNSRYHARMEFNNREGKLSKLIQSIRRQILELAAGIETAIEFQEDQFLGAIPLMETLTPILLNLEMVLQNSRFHEILNRGLRLVMAGKVNVGKSTLFNALLNEECSIVSDTPGTTRDYIREKIYVDGIPISITDMAGLQNESRDEIEKEGINRTLTHIDEADAVLFILDASLPLETVDEEIYSRIREKPKLIVINKTDLVDSELAAAIADRFPSETCAAVSAKYSHHLDRIRIFLQTLIEPLNEKSREIALNFRQQQTLQNLFGTLKNIRQMGESGNYDLEIIAEEIRTALKWIGELTGEATSEEILQKIFRSFCIGK